MANKKRKSGNKRPKSAPQKKSAPQGGQKSHQDAPPRSPDGAGRSSGRPDKTTSDPPKSSQGQNKPGKQGQKKSTGSARRAAQRRAARRKRQMLTVGAPTAVVVVLVVALIALNGGPQGRGKIAPSSDVTISGSPTETLIAEGQKLPTFSAPGLDKGTVSSVEGQPSVVAIWASWCGVCQEELPILNKVKDSYPGVKTISIATSQGEQPGPTAEQFVANNKITIPVAVDDAAGDLRRGMGVTSFPVIYFVNADGTVYKSNLGLLDEGALSSYYTDLQQQVGQATPGSTQEPEP